MGKGFPPIIVKRSGHRRDSVRTWIIVEYGDTAGNLIWTQFANLWPQGVTNKVRVGWSINILLRRAKCGDDSLMVISKNHHLLQLCLRVVKFHRLWVPFPHPHSRLGLQFVLIVSHPRLIKGYNSIQKVSPSFLYHCNNCIVTFHSSCFLFVSEFMQYPTHAHLSLVQMLCNNMSHSMWVLRSYFNCFCWWA